MVKFINIFATLTLVSVQAQSNSNWQSVASLENIETPGFDFQIENKGETYETLRQNIVRRGNIIKGNGIHDQVQTGNGYIDNTNDPKLITDSKVVGDPKTTTKSNDDTSNKKNNSQSKSSSNGANTTPVLSAIGILSYLVYYVI